MTTNLFRDSKLGSSVKPRCYTRHKELKFGKGVIVGASCSCPRDGYDIYIGFDGDMRFNHPRYPWDTTCDSVVEFQFRITDLSVPKSPAKFKSMVTWVCEQLHTGKKIHVGCIGGHGRTGLFIAAVRAEFNGDKEASTWVRRHHCANAIESMNQINFLFKWYGVKKVKPTKSKYRGWVDKQRKGYTYDRVGQVAGYAGQNVIPFKGLHDGKKLKHLTGKGSIWG